MKNLLKEPLLHFLLIGLGLFAVFDLISGEAARETDPRTVVVDKEALLTFIQYRSKAFDRARFEKVLAGMPEARLRALIDDYVREEVLYREAKALKLDKDDYIIRRRLMQKLEFIARGFATAAVEPDDGALRRYFEENKKNYYVQPHVTFTHVFFDNERHGRGKAKALAQAKGAALTSARVAFTDAPRHGDRFPYHVNYVERTPDYVESHFGKTLAGRVFALSPAADAWHGPFESPYGFHLVMLTAKAPGRYPAVEEIVDRVKRDARQALIRKKKDAAIDAIVKSYDVKLVYRRDRAAAARKVSEASPAMGGRKVARSEAK